MRTLFVDACYTIAILNPNDRLHARAVEVSKTLGPHRTVTTEMVLAEILNHFSRKGQALRGLAARAADAIRNDPNAEVIPQTSAQFRSALALYQARIDKAWSLTDCASFLAMAERQITEALTDDQHFAQYGYVALLKDGMASGT